ncbi:MAG: hypothetical protein K2X69_16320 [Silvanigrellaceae bacterium]|nr:hypothetical protein [Silvanigrellaceae bacterium]
MTSNIMIAYNITNNIETSAFKKIGKVVASSIEFIYENPILCTTEEGTFKFAKVRLNSGAEATVLHSDIESFFLKI